jgi:hypothetical protein
VSVAAHKLLKLINIREIGMNRGFRHVGAVAKGSGSGLKMAAIGCVSIAACATKPTYNPQHLSAAQVSWGREQQRRIDRWIAGGFIAAVYLLIAFAGVAIVVRA